MSHPAIGGFNPPQNLAKLITVLDEFLRWSELPIVELLAKFLEARGSVHPAFHANNLIDHLSFITASIGPRPIENQHNSMNS
jgi:hypothetical protein